MTRILACRAVKEKIEHVESGELDDQLPAMLEEMQK